MRCQLWFRRYAWGALGVLAGSLCARQRRVTRAKPENVRYVDEECLMMGQDPKRLEPVFHVLSAIGHVNGNNSPHLEYTTRKGLASQP